MFEVTPTGYSTLYTPHLIDNSHQTRRFWPVACLCIGVLSIAITTASINARTTTLFIGPRAGVSTSGHMIEQEVLHGVPRMSTRLRANPTVHETSDTLPIHTLIGAETGPIETNAPRMLDAIDRKRRAKMPSNTLAEMGSNWWYERASGIWDHTTQIVFLAFVGVPLLARHFKRLPQIKMSMVAVTGQNGAVEPEALVCVCVHLGVQLWV